MRIRATPFDAGFDECALHDWKRHVEDLTDVARTHFEIVVEKPEPCGREAGLGGSKDILDITKEHVQTLKCAPALNKWRDLTSEGPANSAPHLCWSQLGWQRQGRVPDGLYKMLESRAIVFAVRGLGSLQLVFLHATLNGHDARLEELRDSRLREPDIAVEEAQVLCRNGRR